MTADDACKKALAAGRKIIIGLPPEEKMLIRKGDWLTKFAGSRIYRYSLHVEGEANRAAWNEQVVFLFGDRNADKNPIQRGARFYRCDVRINDGQRTVSKILKLQAPPNRDGSRYRL